MNPNKALWEKGDFTRIAESMREGGEALVKGLGITQGLKVLDLVGKNEGQVLQFNISRSVAGRFFIPLPSPSLMHAPSRLQSDGYASDFAVDWPITDC